MKYTIQHRDCSPPESNITKEDFQDLVWQKVYRDVFDDSDMQCLSLIRRQRGNVVSMKVVLRSHEAE